MTAVFIVAWLWIREYSAPRPYDLEPVNLVRNDNSPQEVSAGLVKQFIIDGLEGYKIYRNKKYGFEFQFPDYFKPVDTNQEEFHGESTKLDWIDVFRTYAPFKYLVFKPRNRYFY